MAQTREWFSCKACKSYRVTFRPSQHYWACQDCGASSENQ